MSLEEYRVRFPEKELVPDYVVLIVLKVGVNLIGDPLDVSKFKKLFRKHWGINKSQEQELKSLVKSMESDE